MSIEDSEYPDYRDVDPHGENYPPTIPLPSNIACIDKQHKRVGPREDPYSCETTIVKFKQPHEIQEIRLVEDSFEETAEFFVDGVSVKKFSEPSWGRGTDVNDLLISHCGLDAWSLDVHYHNQCEADEDIRAAEREAGWDPNP